MKNDLKNVIYKYSMNTIQRCRCCRLYKKRKNIVWQRGTSTKNVGVLFVGDAPGKEDDLEGKPFVGLAGKILDEWIKNAEISSYAMINIVKCRTPKDRPPSKTEIMSCLPHFIGQIYELNPKIIVSLGKMAYVALKDLRMELHEKLTPNIGEVFQSIYGKTVIFPHPLLVNRRKDVYVPISKLKEIVRS